MTATAPTGIVTFLFTDIEGSTGRWEAQTAEMEQALEQHDATLRAAVEANEGFLFKHTGDGVLAAFTSPDAAIAAAIEAQRALELPVRMGIATGESQLRDGDYYGPTLNRASRVMSAGHGGQILVATSTASLVAGVELIDLGEQRLRDLSGVQRLYQVRAEGLRVDFPPLRTIDGVPGNLRMQATSFIGRESEVTELTAAVRSHRLVTLTGVGGVGKTRLALQVAAELVPEFPDGVWLVEFGPVGDPSAVPDAVATALGIVQHAGMSVAESIADALAGRTRLLLFDNCEHVLDAAADLVEAIFVRSPTVKVLATSREGLALPAEHLWPVPSLGVRDGADSIAVALFVERARAVVPEFALDGNADAVIEICRRLDGIPLAIELAAARMVSMSPADVRDRLDDRFRLLSGGRRGLERHQTLRHAVQWSYDLLADDERALLNRCAIFAGGFSMEAAVEVCGGDALDEYFLLELLDSLVRKSLLAIDRFGGRTRYTLLETIRQFTEDQIAIAGTGDEVRDRHAAYFAGAAGAMLEVWASARQRVAHEWLDVELANLRAAFRWAMERGDLDTAATIVVGAAFIGFSAQRFEPVAWAEELVLEPRCHDLRGTRRLYVAASMCHRLGRPADGIRYGEAGLTLLGEPRYDSVPYGVDYGSLGAAHLFAGQPDRALEVCTTGSSPEADPLFASGALIVWALASMGRFQEAMALAPDAVATAEATGVPSSIAFVLGAYGKAFAESDPVRALEATRRAWELAHENRVRLYEAFIARDLAGLEAVHGDRRRGLQLFDDTIDSFHHSGEVGPLAGTFATLVVFFDRVNRPRTAAALYGAIRRDTFAMAAFPGLPVAAEHLREVLGTAVFDDLTREGAAMDRNRAVEYAHAEIQQVREELAGVE